MSDTWWVDEGDLSDEQLEVLAEDLGKDILLSGPPGSGKTNILLLRANHLMLDSPDLEFYIVCFTGLLQNFIRLGAHRYQYPAKRIVTQTKLLEQVLSDHGVLPVRHDGEDFRQRQARLKSAAEDLFSTGAARHAFPVLFIDEAQDYPKEDLAIFRHLAKNLNCAADMRQGIYADADSGEAWLNSSQWDSKISLKYHHRVAPAILKVADKVMNGKLNHEPMVGTHQYKGDPGLVEVSAGLDLGDQISIAISRIEKQLQVYPGQLIGVMVPLKDDLEIVMQKFASTPSIAQYVTNANSRYFDSEMPVWVSTVHSAKGLEFRCSHILAADTFAKFHSRERRAVFTAVTRAKTSLAIYHESELHPFFASAIAVKSSAKISMNNIFGKKS